MVTNEMILAFLSVMEHGNLTAAARNTYTTQSNLSKQIALLEKELGVPLLIRAKGHSEVSLTPYGKEFRKLAGNWQQLQKEFESVKTAADVTELSIGALDRMNSFMFRSLYNDLLKDHPEIRLDVHTRHSRDIYRMMEDHRLDIGFVSTLLPVQNLNITPLFYETTMVVCADEMNRKIIDPSDLDPVKEIYSRWSDEFEIWHDQLWPHRQYRIHVGTASMIPNYLNEQGRWALIPVSIVHSLMENYTFSHCQLSEEAPKRKIYMLSPKNPRPSRINALRVFQSEVISHLSKDPLLEMITETD